MALAEARAGRSPVLVEARVAGQRPLAPNRRGVNNVFMTQAPASHATSRRFEPPNAIQFSVFLDNRVGQLHELLEVFDGIDVRVVGMSVIDAQDHGVVRIVTTDHHQARRTLDHHGAAFSVADILVVQIDSLRNLSSLCQVLIAAEININYAYPLFVRPNRKPVVVLHTDALSLSSQVLERNGFGLLNEEDLNETPPEDDANPAG